MGYATTYNLKWKPFNTPVPEYELDDQISSAIREVQDKDGEFMYGIDASGNSTDSCKWYDHEKEVQEFSKKFPNALFTLSGEGEESGDIWRKYFVNGKMQEARAVINFAEFDEKQLR